MGGNASERLHDVGKAPPCYYNLQLLCEDDFMWLTMAMPDIAKQTEIF